MKTYRVWGEYGPVAYDAIEYEVHADSSSQAFEQAVELMKETVYWDRIGERNVYVEEVK